MKHILQRHVRATSHVGTPHRNNHVQVDLIIYSAQIILNLGQTCGYMQKQCK